MRLPLKLSLYILISITVAACASQAPPVATESDSQPVERPTENREKTETADPTRPSPDEEIDLGLEGGTAGEIVVEESGAGLPEAAYSEGDESEDDVVECTNDPDDGSGRPRCADDLLGDGMVSPPE